MMETTQVRHPVAQTHEIPVGKSKIVRIPAFGKEIEIGVFNVNGKFVAYRNVCPHAGAPVCLGQVCGTTLHGEVGEYVLAREGEILRCPWHGWEFDLFTGEHLVDERVKLRGYPVRPEGSESLESVQLEQQEELLFVLLRE